MTQDPSSVFARLLKFKAAESVHPSNSFSQDENIKEIIAKLKSKR
jgi:hypothetical protein